MKTSHRERRRPKETGTIHRRAGSFGAAMAAGLASWALLYGYVGAEVADGAEMRGTIRLAGTPPRLTPHRATTSVSSCGESIQNEDIVTGRGGTLANVVVWVESPQRGAPAKASRVLLDQRQCRFVPHVTSATVGSPIVLTSSDATLHTTHVRLGDRSLFNVAIPVKGMRVTRRLEHTGIHRVACEAGHTWMRGYVHVFDHPYHAVTAADGRFTLPAIPAGQYTIRAWHERLGEQSARVEVRSGTPAVIDLRFAAR